MKRYATPQAGTFEPPFPVYGRTGGRFLVDRSTKMPEIRKDTASLVTAKPAIRKYNRPQLAAVLDVWSGRELWRTGVSEYWLYRGDGTLLRLSGLLEAQALATEHGITLR